MRAGTTVAGIDMPIGVDFSAEAAPLGGGTLEHVRAAFDLDGQDLLVREASALLPGNGRLRLSGRVARDDPGVARFEGDARLDAPVLRTTLRWLDAALPGVLPPGLLAGLPDGVLQRAELSAHVAAGGGDASLQQLAGSLDDAPIVRQCRLQARRAAGLHGRSVAGSHCRWLPGCRRDHPVWPELSRRRRLDAEVRLNIRQATWAGSTIGDLAVDAAVEAGSILLRRIEGNREGRACCGVRHAC